MCRSLLGQINKGLWDRLFKDLFILSFCVYVFACIYTLGIMCMQSVWRPEKRITTPGTGVSGCEPLYSIGNQTQVLFRGSKCSISPAPQTLYKLLEKNINDDEISE